MFAYIKEKMAEYKMRILAVTTVSLVTLVQYAHAEMVDLNATLGPILDAIIALIPSIINLILAIVPAILVLAVVGFIIAFFDKILAMIKL